MADAAPEDIKKALALWFAIQQGKTPQEWQGFVSKHNLQDPFDPWPPTQEKINTFLQKLQEGNAAAAAIDAKKLEELVNEFNQENERAKKISVEAQNRAKEHIRRIINETRVDPTKRATLLHAAIAISQDNPNTPVNEVMSKAVEMGEITDAINSPKPADSYRVSFTGLKNLTPLQKLVAPIADVISTVGVDRVIAESVLRQTDALTTRLGSDIVSREWFRKIVSDANNIINQGTPRSGASNIINDVIGSIFRGAPDQTVIAYLEMYRINAIQGLPEPNFNRVRSSLFHTAAGEVKNFAFRSLTKNFLPGLIPEGGLASGTFRAAAGFLTKAVSWASKLKFAAAAVAAPEVWVIIGILALILFILIGLPNMTQIHMTNTSLATRLNMGGGEGGPLGPVNYTGPAATGSLQCLNYDVPPRQFGNVSGQPFTSAQGTTINNAVSAFPQLGLYNCLLNCPTNKINLYSGGSNTWWGWAPSSSPGNLIIYDGFFSASGGSHAQARLIAHELAHELAYSNPSLISRFDNEGYCGKLCTYPSGTRGACSSLETIDETFAESAAMYLVGENLQSLCPNGYDFMAKLFSQCAGK